MPDSGKTQRQIVWAVVVLFMATLASITLLALFYNGEEDIAVLVTSLLAAVAPTVAVLAGMRANADTARKVDKVASDTHALTNGLLDAKVRANVAEVLPDELVDDTYATGKHRADRQAVADHHDPGPPR